jgi:serine/threonine protein kinase
MSGSGTGGKATGSAGGLPVGSKLGKYEIAERLGAGGEAIVYKGRDPLLDRYVAIKQVAPQLAEDEKFLDRFRDVVRRLSRLGCEEIVTIYELIEDENGTLEFVEGHSIETTLATQPGPVEPKAVLQILWRIAAGLAQIHKAGIIHRDIKPANIIVGEGLRVKITDFGVAARAGVPASMRLGTTKYMAPELFAGTQVDGRADI